MLVEYATKRDLVNRPGRPFGSEPQGARVELTRDAVPRGALLTMPRPRKLAAVGPVLN